MITRRLARPLATWTCPSCTTRSSSLVQQRLQQARGIVSIPPLTHQNLFAEQGIPGFLSSDGYRMAWSQYQEMVLNKLNALVAGEPYENEQVKSLLLRFARDPMAANIFNNASMAFNNNFFFQTFSPSPAALKNYMALEQGLVNTFGSIDTLRTTMLDTADAMFGPGFVWLVYCNTLDDPTGGTKQLGTYRILTTYNAGTPFPEAGYRQQGIDTNNHNEASYQAYQASIPVNSSGAFGAHSVGGKAQAKLPPGGTSLTPLLCVNTWEHVYVRDWGVTGKRRYLADWWDCIDWATVDQRQPVGLRPQRY